MIVHDWSSVQAAILAKVEAGAHLRAQDATDGRRKSQTKIARRGASRPDTPPAAASV